MVFIFESNLAFESQHLLHAIEAAGVKRWVSLSEGQAGTHGWLTVRQRSLCYTKWGLKLTRPVTFPCVWQTNERKEQMCLLVREALTVGKIAFHKNFFSLEIGAGGAKRQLKDELLSYCVVTEPAKTMFGKTRKTFTGKVHGVTCTTPPRKPVCPTPIPFKNVSACTLSGKQDDLVIALQLACIGCSKFYQDPRYRSFRTMDWTQGVSGMKAGGVQGPSSTQPFANA